MKWFDKWFANKCKQAWENEHKVDTYAVPTPGRISKNSSINSPGLELTIYGADGGTVLEFRKYDMSRDRTEYSLHVISSADNFEDRLSQAITMEMLKRGISI